MKLYRDLKLGTRGDDVHGAKRAIYKFLNRHNNTRWKYFQNMKPVSKQVYGIIFRQHVIKAQKKLGIKSDKRGVFGQHTLDALEKVGSLDAVSSKLLATAEPKPAKEDLMFAKLMASMKEMAEHTPGYQLGGGHGRPLSSVSPYQKLDCSSSTSKALFDAGMFTDDVAWVSGTIAWRWGIPGKGKYFTVYANNGHVFIRLHKGGYWRFDTSPHGDGGSGPMLRKLPRFTSSFAVRHWPGM